MVGKSKLSVLDCSTVETTLKSLSKLLRTDVETVNMFIESNKYRITNEDKCWHYDNLYIGDVLDFFNLRKDEIFPDKLLMFHLTSGIDDSSFRQNGILNLQAIIKNDILSSFFTNSGVEIHYEEGSPPLIHSNGKVFKDEIAVLIQIDV